MNNNSDVPLLKGLGVILVLLSIFWRGGRISGEYNDPPGDLVWPKGQGSLRVIEAQDLATGQALPTQLKEDGGQLHLSDVPVGGTPVAVRWR